MNARQYRNFLRHRYGLWYSSLVGIDIQRRQLSRDGLSSTQIDKAITNLHPRLMANLRVSKSGRLRVVNRRLTWIRRTGWTEAPR